MTTRYEELLEQRKAIVTEINAIELKKDLDRAEKLIGKCFKYAGDDPTYYRIIGHGDFSSYLKAFRFDAGDGLLSVGTSEESITWFEGYCKKITEKQFDAAWTKFKAKLTNLAEAALVE
jgi:hypothetical protein